MSFHLKQVYKSSQEHLNQKTWMDWHKQQDAVSLDTGISPEGTGREFTVKTKSFFLFS